MTAATYYRPIPPNPNHTNDNDDTIKSASLWYLDGDKDGVGGPTSVSAFTDPSNSSMSYLTTSGDECDNDPSKTKKNIWYFTHCT